MGIHRFCVQKSRMALHCTVFHMVFKQPMAPPAANHDPTRAGWVSRFSACRGFWWHRLGYRGLRF